MGYWGMVLHGGNGLHGGGVKELGGHFHGQAALSRGRRDILGQERGPWFWIGLFTTSTVHILNERDPKKSSLRSLVL